MYSKYTPLCEKPPSPLCSKIWHKFQTRPLHGKSYTIKIIDLSPERHEEVVEFLKTYFFPDEPLCSTLKLSEDESASTNYFNIVRKIMNTNKSLLAVLDEDIPSPEIIGVQILYVKSREDHPYRDSELNGEKLAKLKRIIDDLHKKVDSFGVLDTDKYMQGFGLSVKREYRGLNIAFEIIRTIEKIARKNDVAACMNMYSAIQSQILAQKAGFKVYGEIIYDEYKNEQGQRLAGIDKFHQNEKC